jgi:hypothetical protein
MFQLQELMSPTDLEDSPEDFPEARALLERITEQLKE